MQGTPAPSGPTRPPATRGATSGHRQRRWILGLARSGAGAIVGLLGLLGLIGLIGATETGPALAYSCVPADVEELRERSDAGFVGTIIEVAPTDGAPTPLADTVYTFSIERWIHGNEEPTPIVVYGPAALAWDFGFVDDRVAVFTTTIIDGRHVTDICMNANADQALAQVDPLPEPQSGTADIAVVGGFADGPVAHFDATGRFLGHRGDPEIGVVGPTASCHDGATTAVYLGPAAASADGREPGRVLVLDLALGAPVGPAIEVPVDDYPVSFDCASGRPLRALIEQAGGGLAVATTDTTTSLTTGGVVGRDWVVAGTGIIGVDQLDPGERLVRTEVGRPEVELAILPRADTDDPYTGYASLAVAPAGDRLAVLEVAYREEGRADSTLRIIDATTGRQLTDRSVTEESYRVEWVDQRHLAWVFGGDRPDRTDVLDAETLTPVGSVPGWPAWQSALSDGALWGVARGTLYRADIDGGSPQKVHTFPYTTVGFVSAIDGPVPDPTANAGEGVSPADTPTASIADPRPTVGDEGAAGVTNEREDGREDGTAEESSPLRPWFIAATFAGILATMAVVGMRAWRRDGSDRERSDQSHQ